MLKLTLHDSIETIDAARWDSVGSDPLSSHAVLAALERAALPGIRTWYATIEDRNGRLAAAAPISRIEMDGGRLTHGAFRFLIRTVRKCHPGFLRTALMACGTPLSVGNPPLRLARDSDAVAVLRELAGLLRELGETERAPWLAFKEFQHGDLTAARAALAGQGAGWILAPSEPNSRIRIRWRSYDEYLGDLRSHYRYKVRSAARRLAEQRVIVDVVPLAESYDSSLHALYEAVVERAAVQLEHLTPEFFVALGQAYPDKTPLIRFRRDGNLIGWVAMLFADEMAYDFFHGIDYAESEPTALYFNQLAEVVRLTIDRGARSLSLGQSTEIAKARFGGETVPLWVALRHRSTAITALLRGGRRLLFPAKSVPPRRVFRDAGVGEPPPEPRRAATASVTAQAAAPR